MHPTVWRRLFGALLALWFSAYAAEPAGMVACPMHGAQVMTAHGAHAMMHASSGSDMGTARPVHEPTPSHDGGSHHCTCFGHCCGASVAAPVARQAELSVATTLLVPIAVVPTVGERSPQRAEHILPFATAPPIA